MSGEPQSGAQGVQRLGRYEILGEIASGGMATVYLGRLTGSKGFQRLVAIKRLHPHLESEEDFVAMFLDEARLAARIRHPNCVATLDVEDQDGLYIVMEYIEGDRLLTLLRHAAKTGEPIPPPVALRIALDTLAGLHAAHELCDDDGQPLGLVHRDVSPQNILIGVDGVARLTDFGIAKATSRLTVTRDGQLKGKIAYMAPEQTRRVEIDRRVDIFAMGIITWEMFTSKKLFNGESDVEVLNQLLFEPIPRLKDHAPGIPAALDAVVMKALERDPARRYNTALEFSDALEQVGKLLGGPANPRLVAAHLQKVAGEKLAKDRARLSTGALPAADPSQGGTPSGVKRRPTMLGLGTPPAPAAPAPVPPTRARTASQTALPVAPSAPPPVPPTRARTASQTALPVAPPAPSPVPPTRARTASQTALPVAPPAPSPVPPTRARTASQTALPVAPPAPPPVPPTRARTASQTALPAAPPTVSADVSLLDDDEDIPTQAIERPSSVPDTTRGSTAPEVAVPDAEPTTLASLGTNTIAAPVESSAAVSKVSSDSELVDSEPTQAIATPPVPEPNAHIPAHEPIPSTATAPLETPTEDRFGPVPTPSLDLTLQPEKAPRSSGKVLWIGLATTVLLAGVGGAVFLSQRNSTPPSTTTTSTTRASVTSASDLTGSSTPNPSTTLPTTPPTTPSSATREGHGSAGADAGTTSGALPDAATTTAHPTAGAQTSAVVNVRTNATPTGTAGSSAPTDLSSGNRHTHTPGADTLGTTSATANTPSLGRPRPSLHPTSANGARGHSSSRTSRPSNDDPFGNDNPYQR